MYYSSFSLSFSRIIIVNLNACAKLGKFVLASKFEQDLTSYRYRYNPPMSGRIWSNHLYIYICCRIKLTLNRTAMRLLSLSKLPYTTTVRTLAYAYTSLSSSSFAFTHRHQDPTNSLDNTNFGQNENLFSTIFCLMICCYSSKLLRYFINEVKCLYRVTLASLGKFNEQI